MRIEISDISEKVVYTMDITNRITIIRGNSATGKSVLVRLIDNIGKPQVKVSSNIDIIHINSKLILEGFPLKEDRIYIMDEDDGIERPEVVKKINDKRYKFILITRKEDFGTFSYDIYQIYHFKNSGKYHNLTRTYGKIDNSHINQDNLQNMITEDSNSGFEFFNRVCDYQTYSANGNSNIPKYLINDSIVLIDRVGFGPYIKRTLNRIKYQNIALICPLSFEYLILSSRIFNYNEKNYLKLQNSSKNLEEYYYKLLKSVSNDYSLWYSKQHINEWFTISPQKDKILNKISLDFGIKLKIKDNRPKFIWE